MMLLLFRYSQNQDKINFSFVKHSVFYDDLEVGVYDGLNRVLVQIILIENNEFFNVLSYPAFRKERYLKRLSKKELFKAKLERSIIKLIDKL